MTASEMLRDMGPIGMGVMLCLLGLSIYSIAMIFDKFRRFRAAQLQSLQFLPAFGRCLNEGKLQDAMDSARRHDKSHVARVVRAGVSEFVEGGTQVADADVRVEMVSRALERSANVTLADMKRGLGGLATIGSTAPFIGLFGTVIGIIHAFQGIAESGSGGIAAVSGGIAEALIATALGIFVAIPAVMAFNYFTGSLERFHVEMATASAELVDFLHKRTRTAHASR